MTSRELVQKTLAMDSPQRIPHDIAFLAWLVQNKSIGLNYEDIIEFSVSE